MPGFVYRDDIHEHMWWLNPMCWSMTSRCLQSTRSITFPTFVESKTSFFPLRPGGMDHIEGTDGVFPHLPARDKAGWKDVCQLEGQGFGEELASQCQVTMTLGRIVWCG
ncbi:Hypothetical predicted protein [Pelobates cultripes]|uniref:Uncharacterized protein n=1 Tax=Pelobates cultripes TaxID=61616 RepID=A0AAD1SZA1_PELCU|nr:Hypothetical predicted protein [Pelobates cultripes]